MSNYLALPFLPPQTVGEETETTNLVTATNEAAAKQLFDEACERLSNINNWHKLCGILSANFQLTNELAEPISNKAEQGNYIRIDIPGPATSAGKGYDWVKIEKVDYLIIGPTQKLYLIQARPAAVPGSNTTQVAHFLTDKATSSFVVMLDGTTVTATIFGRNEVPNTTEVDGTLDKIRNAFIGSTGAVGLSKLQWKALVDGVLGLG